MNVIGFRRICSVNYFNLNKFRYAHAKEAEIEFLPKQDAQITQSSAGITVASVENYSPLTKVSVVIKAGSRYETASNKGIVHLLRNCAVLSTKNHTPFAITKILETQGIKLGLTSTRELLIYDVHCARDSVDSGLEILADVVCNSAFKPWEVNDIVPRLHIDSAIHNQAPEALLHEALHKVAFRGGLSNSLYCEPHMIGKHTVEMLHSYVNEHFTTSRTSVIGLGIPHEHLESHVSNLFGLNELAPSNDAATKFAPGELRIESDTPFVHAAIVAEGASLANTKEMLSLCVLQCILGLGPHIALSDSRYSKLGEKAASASNTFHVSGLNLNYSDTGLFGVYVVGQPNDMRQLVKAVVSEMRTVSKSISDQSVKIAKHKLKAKLMLERDTSNSALSAMAFAVSQCGKIEDAKEVEKAIDELQTADIASAAAKVMKAKPAMVSLGPLHSMPYVDELL